MAVSGRYHFTTRGYARAAFFTNLAELKPAKHLRRDERARYGEPILHQVFRIERGRFGDIGRQSGSPNGILKFLSGTFETLA